MEWSTHTTPAPRTGTTASATASGEIQPLRAEFERLDALVDDLDADSIAAERTVLDAVGDLADRYAAAVDAQRSATQRAGLDADAAATALAVSPFADAAEARAELLESGVESDWRAAVEAWREKAGRLVNELAGLEKADVPPVRPDVDAAQHAAATAEDRAKALRDLTQRAKTFLDGARKALDEADRIDVESAELRQQAETARLVAETCAGKGGLLRMRLDRWVLARLEALVQEVEQGFDAFDTVRATRPIRTFITDFSTWYVRRSRDRIRQGGAETQEALATITLNPARQLGIDQRVGSIDIGKDADLVLYDKHPLSNYARVKKVWIDGEVYYRED